jgi:hypothetical protein
MPTGALGRLGGAILFATSCLLAARVAHAAADESTKRAAKTACLAGDYAKGVALLAELYVDTSDPMYIFNQGRCFEQNGRYEDAVIRFREYQRKNADAGGAPDPQAEKHIGDCLALIEIQRARTSEQNQAPSAAAAVAPGPGATNVQPAVSAAQPPDSAAPAGATQPVPAGAGSAVPSVPIPAASPDRSPMPVQKKLGYGAAALGLVGVGVGVAAYLVAQDHLDKSSALGCSDTSCVGKGKEEYNSAQTAITVSNAACISGGILLVGGVVLVLISSSATLAARGVAFVPLVGPGFAQATLSGRF